jgi:hypothetical protein
MRRKASTALLLPLVGLLIATPVRAQVFTPVYISPRLTNDLGAAYNDGPGGFSLEAIWRGGPYGLRVGYADAAGGLLALGAEFRNIIPIPDAPVGLAFTAAVQGLIGDESAYGLQVGLSGGYPFFAGDVVITPYLHPRLASARTLPPEDEDGRFRFTALADVGIDVAAQGRVLFRVAATIAGLGARWGLGVSLIQ